MKQYFTIKFLYNDNHDVSARKETINLAYNYIKMFSFDTSIKQIILNHYINGELHYSCNIETTVSEKQIKPSHFGVKEQLLCKL